MTHSKVERSSQVIVDPERKIRELTVLYEISKHFISVSDTREVLVAILDILHAKMGMNRGTITIFDPITHGPAQT
ncbi:MAG: hypothetical protein ACMUIP_10220 [bacterium]